MLLDRHHSVENVFRKAVNVGTGVGRKLPIRFCSVASIVASIDPAEEFSDESAGGSVSDMTGAITCGGGTSDGGVCSSIKNVEPDEAAVERQAGERLALGWTWCTRAR